MSFRIDGGVSTSSIEFSSYLNVMHEIHVLLVDQEGDVRDTTKVLENCRYKVKLATRAYNAMEMLLMGKNKFDLIIVNIDSPDAQIIQLVQQATSMEIPIILTSWDANPAVVYKAIEMGAFMCVRKPLNNEMMVSMWQHLLRENMRKQREKQRGCSMDELASSMLGVGRGKEKNKKMKLSKMEGDHSLVMIKEVKRKECTEWTAELHDKFLVAVQQLGEGRCFPKEILELMNVPGLTRMQVASHLQKCRNDNWRSPEERKAMMSQQQNATTSMEAEATSPQNRPRRFGSMPKILASESKSKSESTSQYQQMEAPAANVVVNEALPMAYQEIDLWMHHLQGFHQPPGSGDMGGPCFN